MAERIDTRTEGLDLYVYVARTFADTPWLHYGLWEKGETPSIPRLRMAQERYVERLLGFLPPAPARVLDIGGGTGEMARVLRDRGYEVEMLTPSVLQADIAREKLGPGVPVHTTKFEDFTGSGPYDVCLFSESFQYVRVAPSLALIAHILAPEGRVVIADCFRSEGYPGGRAVGGGHRFPEVVEALDGAGFAIVRDEDVTEMAAGSIALDQKVYREFVAPVAERANALLAARRPALHRLASWAYAILVPARERRNIRARLKADYRSPEAFMANNTYRFLSIVNVARRPQTER